MSLWKVARFRAVLLLAAFTFAGPAVAAESKTAGSPLRGTYQNADGMTIIEFLSEGKAYLSFHGFTQECTHKQSGKKIVLTCDDEDTVFAVNDDGALSGPPDSFLVRMKKKP